MSERTTWQPHRGAQQRFLNSGVTEALGGGSKGGGKSECLLFGALRWIGEPSYRALIIRRSFKELEQLWDRAAPWYKAYGGVPNVSAHRWVFPSSSVIEFGYLESDADADRYNGREYSYLGIDEVTQISKKSYLTLVSCLRSSAGLPICIRLTCNPDGPDSWVFHRWRPWLDPREEYQGPRAQSGQPLYYRQTDGGEEWCERGPGTLSRMFVRMSVQDNPTLMESDPGYVDRLGILDPVERARLRDGDWLTSPAAGMYFKRIWFKTPTPLDSQVVNRVRAWDLGSTLDGDWTVGVGMARTRTGGYVIEDVKRIRARPAERDALILSTAEADGRRVKVVLPQDPAAAGVAQRDAHAKMMAGYIVKFVRPTGSKITRAAAFSSQCEAGNVACAAGAWREPFLACLEGFPDAKHDDDVDASADAFNSLVHTPVEYPDDDWVGPKRWDAEGGDDEWERGGNGGGWDSTN